jgi:trimeric autotransporter adhesin
MAPRRRAFPEPVVSINFNSRKGLTVAAGADRSTIRALSLVGANNAAVTLLASNVTIQGNYIGLLTDGAAEGNRGDG